MEQTQEQIERRKQEEKESRGTVSYRILKGCRNSSGELLYNTSSVLLSDLEGRLKKYNTGVKNHLVDDRNVLYMYIRSLVPVSAVYVGETWHLFQARKNIWTMSD